MALLFLSILGLAYYYNKAEELRAKISEYEKSLKELKRILVRKRSSSQMLRRI